MFKQATIIGLTLCSIGACAAEGADAQRGVEAPLEVGIPQMGTIERDEWNQYGPFEVEEGGALIATLDMVNGDADLYVRLGARPTESESDCRPYLSGTQTERCDVTDAGMVYVAVAGYAWSTKFEIAVHIAGGTGELCGNGRLDEGEACDGTPIECSALNPEWTWGTASCLGDCSGWDVDACNPSHAAHFSDGGTLPVGQWRHYGPFNSVAGAFHAKLGAAPPSGTGDADLYVRRGRPATADDFDCRSNGPASQESCTSQGPGLFYVSVYGYATVSDYTLDVDYLFDDTIEQPRVNEGAGNVRASEWAFFGPYFHGPGAVQVVMSGTNDADLYVRSGARPTERVWDCRPYAGGSDELCELAFDVPGELWVGVRGYEPASYFELLSVYVAD